jgi:hypothetical protein
MIPKIKLACGMGMPGPAVANGMSVARRVSLPAELKIWCDASPHWLIAPAHDMLLSRYVAALDTLNLGFVRVE